MRRTIENTINLREMEAKIFSIKTVRLDLLLSIRL